MEVIPPSNILEMASPRVRNVVLILCWIIMPPAFIFFMCQRDLTLKQKTLRISTVLLHPGIISWFQILFTGLTAAPPT